MNYSFEDHIHHFAVWTAARSVNRDFTKTEIIRSAIENSCLLPEYIHNALTSQNDFNIWHSKAANALIEEFANLHTYCSYGRASKIIAMYLKTALVIRLTPDDPRSLVVHPPIDRILLSNLASALKRDYPSHVDKKKELLKINWTTMNEAEYTNLIHLLEIIGAPINWKLEVHWKV